VVLVLNERLGKEALGIESTRRRRLDHLIQTRHGIGIIASDKHVHDPAEEISGEVNVDDQRLIVQQRYTFANPRCHNRAGNRSQLGVWTPRPRDVGADQLFLKPERIVQIGARLLEGSNPPLEQLEEVSRHHLPDSK
jgi:hypothetical protein